MIKNKQVLSYLIKNEATIYSASETICRGLPSVIACAVFLLALCRSLQMVPLETPIFCPASSCDSPSRSTSLKASSSAMSMNMGSRFLAGFGIKPVIGGIIPSVTGFGNLPLLPRLRLCLRRHNVLSHVFVG